jgi:hypothetical protein
MRACFTFKVQWMQGAWLATNVGGMGSGIHGLKQAKHAGVHPCLIRSLRVLFSGKSSDGVGTGYGHLSIGSMQVGLLY